MTTPEREDSPEFLAGEYVLGSLEPGERQVVDAERRRNPALDSAIEHWEDLFAPLVVAVAPIVPSEGLYSGILRRIGVDLRPGSRASRQPQDSARPTGAFDVVGTPTNDQVIRLRRSVRAWKGATALLGTLAASLLVGIGLSAPTPDRRQRFVAFLQQQAGTPAFLVSVDLASRAMSVRPIKTEPHDDKNYQLWLVSDKLDKVPKSLGVIGEGPVTVGRILGNYDRGVLTDATYAVSIEPRGGSPTSGPTGPVLWTGRLVQAIP